MEQVRASCHDAMGLAKSELYEIIGEESCARNLPVKNAHATRAASGFAA